MLYVVATPIGNLGDMSPRAIKTLEEVDLIAAEDTRHSIKLLNHFDIHTPLTSLHEHNEQSKSQSLVRKMIEEGINIALISDAGTPAISDPGALFVKAATQAGIETLTIPGPSAAIAALSISGFNQPSFTFYGFLPRDSKSLREKLKSMGGKDELAIIHESPFRVKKLLQTILESLGDLPLSLSCDLSKLHELTIRGTVSRVLEAFKANDKAEKGEYVVVVDLSETKKDMEAAREDIALEARLLSILLQGRDMQQAMKELINDGERKNAVYAASLHLKSLLRDDCPHLS
ncbi:MAG: 16S rRNA (cytidine(1402)-2'-O)-methyltransferase [Clostridiales bacterium]|nr:16S rRNA (cytidine(1402)-2'-O)-methyltransferase [Clostridiales bacterium]